MFARKLPCKSCQRRDSIRQRVCWDCNTLSFFSKRKQTNRFAARSNERTIIMTTALRRSLSSCSLLQDSQNTFLFVNGQRSQKVTIVNTLKIEPPRELTR